MFALNEAAGGKCEELENLLPALFEKVIPRLLRPLETDGNTVTPMLVHGDLWCGNASMRLEDDAPIVFDPSSFWAHNECKRFPFPFPFPLPLNNFIVVDAIPYIL